MVQHGLDRLDVREGSLELGPVRLVERGRDDAIVGIETTEDALSLMAQAELLQEAEGGRGIARRIHRQVAGRRQNVQSRQRAGILDAMLQGAQAHEVDDLGDDAGEGRLGLCGEKRADDVEPDGAAGAAAPPCSSGGRNRATLPSQTCGL